MTSQTIDGLSRELLEKIANGLYLRRFGIDWANELRALLDAPAVAIKPFRMLVKSCRGPVSKPIEKADESTWPDIESARQYFGAEQEVCRDRASHLIYISPGEWFATPLYAEQPAPVAFDFELAAQKLASCMDYPWEHMPEQGRDSMREHAKAIVNAAVSVAVVLPSRDQLRDIIAQAIGGDTYDCVRTWGAWGAGTMTQDDFVSVVDQDDRLYEIADACLGEVASVNGVKP